MATQYSGTVVAQTFVGTDPDTILNGIHTALLAAGWTDLPRFRAKNRFRNLPSFNNYGMGNVVILGGVSYTFGGAGVPIGLTAAQTMANFSAAVSGDVNFESPFGGQFEIAVDGAGAAGILVVGRNNGLTQNNLAFGIVPVGIGTWDTPVSSGGGYEMQSAKTPHGLQCRVQLIGEYSVPAGAIVAHVYITSNTEEFTSNPITLLAGPPFYQIVADPYQFFVSVPGSTIVNNSACTGVPYLPDFLRPQEIHTATTTLSTPIVCQTSAPHNLVNGQTILLMEAQQTVTVTNTVTSPNPFTPGYLEFIASNDFKNSDVIVFTSGNPQDGAYLIRNVTSTQFTGDNSFGVVGLSGTATGPAHTMIGQWTVTVVDGTHFQLNGSSGSGFPYVNDSAVFAIDRHLARCIWGAASDGGTNFRSSLTVNNSTQTALLNQSGQSYQTIGQDVMRFLLAGVIGANPLKFSNNLAIAMEPILAAGVNGILSQPLAIGQLWDAVINGQAQIVDLTCTMDGHTFVCYSTQPGDGTDYQGSLWLAKT